VTSVDVFHKCYHFAEARIAREGGYYPYYYPISSEHGAEVVVDGKRMIMMGRNDYLGLAAHPKVKEAATAATAKYGTSCTASRFVSGTLDLHCELEDKIAEFLNKEAALVFTTGMQANLGAISCLAGANDILITDKYDHASIIDGCRLSLGHMRRFKHNDMDSLERILQHLAPDKGKLIVVDGVYSMEGDIADLPHVVAQARQYGARVMLDDAHGIGVLSEQEGKGTAEHFGLSREIDLIMGTFSKSLASIGGFIAADFQVIDYLKHFARSMIFSAALPAGATAAASAALDIMQREPDRRRRLWENTRKLLAGLQSLGYNTGKSCTPIIPIVIPSRDAAVALWQRLFARGVFTSIVIPPAIPKGYTMIRMSVSALHTDAHIDCVLDECRVAAVEAKSRLRGD